MNFNKIVKYLFVTLGLIFLILSVIVYFRTNNFVNKSAKTDGIVIEIRKELSKKISSDDEDPDTTSYYRPVVQFEDRKMNKIIFSSSVASNPPDYKVNDKVEVLYLPESPNVAEINIFIKLWGGAILLAVMGVGFLGLGLIYLFFR